MAIRRHAAGSIVVLDLSLVLGFLISQALTGFLAIECRDKEVPAEQASAVDEVVPDTIAGLGETPALEHRFVDTGAVGGVADLAAYEAQTDYQHTSGALEQVLLPEAPYVDEEDLARVDEEWRAYIDHVVAMGYYGVFVGGFLEYVWLLAAGGAVALIGGLLAIGRRRRLADGVAVGA